jgi:glycogen debranching enzyme
VRSLRVSVGLVCCLLFLSHFACAQNVVAQTNAPAASVAKFAFRKSGLELERPSRAGAFYSVTGRRAAAFGYEHRPLEAWVYPLKILDDFQLSFSIEGYPLEFGGADTLARINVRPEATTFIYSHAAFTVRQTIFAPLDEPGIIMLLDVQSVLPLTVNVSFRPRLRLSWPAGLMTGSLSWNERGRVYYITEETKRFAGIIGSPAASDTSVMPYQEEPRDVPARFRIVVPAGEMSSRLLPIIIAGSVEGREQAKVAYDRMLASVPTLYEKNVAHYERLEAETLGISTPDRELNEAFGWAKVGVDKGVVTNPLLGTGLVAGYRTSGESERPGFAWFFGRDALWTALALNSYGDFRTTRTALDFLKKFQRVDGKIPHEISQSASLIPWFTDYEYPWASADATPLYVIAHADYFRATGDLEFLRANWDSILKAYRFTEATDTDANGLVENTKFGHGWVEGGGLYPPHEEIYMQGLWVAASRDLASLAEVLKARDVVKRARANAERTRAATEARYWLPARGFYAYATKQPAKVAPEEAEPGPSRARRQARLNALKDATSYDENTVLPAVPLWFKTLSNERAQLQIDELGSGALATDWGTRILSDESQLYDPLSYHAGSVWPLFTGWASMGAYAYGRPHVGFQALMANALLTRQGAEGYVTELLSGDFNAPFGRSSHHQVWSEAMVITPLVRGLLGIEAGAAEGDAVLRLAPQLPANWNELEVRNLRLPNSYYDVRLLRRTGQTTVSFLPRRADGLSVGKGNGERSAQVTVSLALPLDARVSRVAECLPVGNFSEVLTTCNTLAHRLTRVGDVQRVETILSPGAARQDLTFLYEEGTDVYTTPEKSARGERSRGLRILRSRADATHLRLLLEGLGGHTYTLGVRSTRELLDTPGVQIRKGADADSQLLITFAGAPDRYVRREIIIPLQASKAGRRK